MAVTATSSMSEANQAKTTRGHEAQNALERTLFGHLDEGRLSAVERNFRVGRPGYGNDAQFYAPFMIQFGDGVRWIVYNTTSLRDRVKEQLWDALNIKAVDTRVERAYLVHPSVAQGCTPKEAESFERKNAQYAAHEEYSSLDGVIDWDALDRLIREKADADYEALHPRRSGGGMTPGQKYDFEGRAFEREIAETLADAANLAAWKAGARTGGAHYSHFLRMVREFGLEPEKVKGIRATSRHEDIGDLPSGGAPKTDVIAWAELADGTERMVTISCKNVSGKMVTGHQYKADTFADVLDKDNATLRRDLNIFQLAGSWQIPEDVKEELARELAPHVEKLCRWVVGGEGLACEEKHRAQYLVAYRPSDNSFAVHSADAYVRILLSLPRNKEGGTPFSWTYQGRRGANIQLKMPVVF